MRMTVRSFNFALCLSLNVLSINLVAGIASAGEHRSGELIDVGGYRLNSIRVPRPATADLPSIVFIHGASANLLDPMGAFREKLEGRAELLFFDRPGYGYSERGSAANNYPKGQADALAVLMKKRGIKKAIIVSHSFGGAIAASFALDHPEMVSGLVFLSPAVYPWPGGIAWYYDVSKTPLIGWVFSGLVVPPVGLALLDGATKNVFAPNKRPDDYIRRTRTDLILRPASFRYNAMDIANLSTYTAKIAPRYPEIKKPTVIITGDRDETVSPKIHSFALSRAISGSKLISIHNLGHKPDYIVPDVVIAAIETVAGKRVNIDGVARKAQARIANDGKR